MTATDRQSPGYIVLATVLVVFVVLTVLTISAPLLSINDGIQALNDSQANQSRNLTEACVEELLWKINQTNAAPTVITLPEGSCGVTVNSQAGDAWTVTVATNSQAFPRTIRLELSRTSTISISRWQEQ